MVWYRKVEFQFVFLFFSFLFSFFFNYIDLSTCPWDLHAVRVEVNQQLKFVLFFAFFFLLFHSLTPPPHHPRRLRLLANHIKEELHFISEFIETCKILFWSITQEPLNLLKFQWHQWVSQTICFRMLVLLFQKKFWQFWDSAQNMHSYSDLRCSSSLT